MQVLLTFFTLFLKEVETVLNCFNRGYVTGEATELLVGSS